MMPAVGRFFLVVRPWHPVIVAGMAVMVAIAVPLLAAGRIRATDTMAPMLMLQALATSSGFAGPARRGHYDFLIAGGHRRLSIGVTHWAVSAAPGIVVWAVLALVDMGVHGTGGTSAFRPAAIGAMLLVSTLPWAATVPAARLTGGLVWLLLVVAAVTTMRVPFIINILLCPWLLARGGISDPLRIPVAIVSVAAVTTMAAALWWIDRSDIPLETAQ